MTRPRDCEKNVTICVEGPNAPDPGFARLLLAEVKKPKKHLGKEIKRRKIPHWNKLCAEIEDELWAHAYKIVLRKLGNGEHPVPKHEIRLEAE